MWTLAIGGILRHQSEPPEGGVDALGQDRAAVERPPVGELAISVIQLQ